MQPFCLLMHGGHGNQRLTRALQLSLFQGGQKPFFNTDSLKLNRLSNRTQLSNHGSRDVQALAPRRSTLDWFIWDQVIACRQHFNKDIFLLAASLFFAVRYRQVLPLQML